MAFTIFDERNAFSWAGVLDSSNTPGFITINGSTSTPIRLDGVFVSNSDVIDHIVSLDASQSGIITAIVNINVPARSGFDGIAPVEIISAQMPSTYQGFVVPLFCYANLSTPDTLLMAAALTAFAVGGTL
ncbi:MAG TPA: hypothetical protein VNS88_14845 [Nitrospiraceae bacterium]|nr:hypothetical protein [Nitrospiraceae bacterium]